MIDIYVTLANILPFIFFLFIWATQSKSLSLTPVSNKLCIVFFITYLILLTLGGFDEINEMHDKDRYKKFFMYFNSERITEYKDMGWYYYVLICKLFFEDYNIFFFLTSLIYCGGYLILSRRLMGKEYMWYFFIFSTGMMGFSGYGTNTIRNGVALSFFLVALTTEKQWQKLALFLVAIMMHKAAFILIAAYLISRYVPLKPMYYIIVWGACLLLAISGFSLLDYTDFFVSEDDERFAIYSVIMSHGLRYDFIIYSVVPLLLSYYWIVKYKIKDVFFINMFGMYTLLNALWLLVIQMAFTNRFAYFSWAFIPILLFYPYTAKNKVFNFPKQVLFRYFFVFLLIGLILSTRDLLLQDF